jgi:hypothetical protein
MKRKNLCLIMFFSLLILTACGKNGEVGVNELIDEINKEIEEIEKSTSYEIKIEKLEEIIPGENNDIDAKVSYEYPVIKNEKNSEIINQINEKFKNETEVAFNIQVADFKEMLPEIREWKKAVGTEMEYSSESRFKVEYNKNNIISFSEDIYFFTGGAYPNTGKASKTIDLETGKDIELKDIFTISDEEIYELALTKFYELTDKEEIFFDKEIIKEQIKNVEFYLTEDKIVFFFNENIIGPHALGTPSVEVLFDENLDIFNEKIIF